MYIMCVGFETFFSVRALAIVCRAARPAYREREREKLHMARADRNYAERISATASLSLSSAASIIIYAWKHPGRKRTS
jgi:hypothetical protein